MSEGKFVFLWCPESDLFIRVTSTGRLFADLTTHNDDPEALFELIPLEGGLGSALLSHKYKQYVTRGTTFPRFHFETASTSSEAPNTSADSNKPDSHQQFAVEGDYLVAFGNLKKPKYLHVGEDRQVFPDSDNKTKIKLLFKHDIDKSGIEALKASINGQMSSEQAALAAVEKLRINTEVLARRDPNSNNNSNSTPSSTSESDSKTPTRKEGGRVRYNTTSSLYIKDTITRPDINELTWCMSVRLRQIMLEDLEEEDKISLKIFDERVYPILSYSQQPNWEEIPYEDIIYRFINPIFRTVSLSPEIGVLSLVYIERLRELTGLTLCGSNWRRVCLSCLILASKVFEDLAVWNVDFQPVSKKITTKDLNEMEKYLLTYLQYNVSLKSSMYAKYFFELRSLSELDVTKFPIKPLDESQLQTLEARSATSEDKVRNELSRHIQTVGSNDKKAGSRVVLS